MGTVWALFGHCMGTVWELCTTHSESCRLAEAAQFRCLQNYRERKCCKKWRPSAKPVPWSFLYQHLCDQLWSPLSSVSPFLLLFLFRLAPTLGNRGYRRRKIKLKSPGAVVIGYFHTFLYPCELDVLWAPSCSRVGLSLLGRTLFPLSPPRLRSSNTILSMAPSQCP